MKKILLFLLLVPVFAHSQKLDTLTQNTLNRYVVLINNITSQSEDLLTNLKSCYDNVERYREKKADRISFFHFIIKPDDNLAAFFQKRDTSGKLNGERQIFQKTVVIWECMENINKKTASLETYMASETFLTDNFKGFQTTIQEIEKLFNTFHSQTAELTQLVQKTYRLYQPYNISHPFHREEMLMQQILEKEKQALQLWKFDFNDHVHSGWIVTALEKNIAESADLIKKLKENNAKIPQNNQEGGIYGSFVDLAESVQHTKSGALVDYNDDARLNDEHINQAYLNLLHQINQDLTENFNSFVNYRRQFGDRFIYAFKYVPVFEVNLSENLSDIQVHKFKEVTVPELKMTSQNMPPSKPMTDLFNEYIEYINEGIAYCQNLNEQLSSYKLQTLVVKEALRKKQNANLTYTDLPLAITPGLYESIASDNTNVPEVYRRPLLQQVEVLRNIIREMNVLSKELALYVKNKTYITDNFKRSNEITARYVVLYNTFDIKKERLYSDICKIYNSYRTPSPINSWHTAAKALNDVLESDKQLLANIKSYFYKKTSRAFLPGNMEEKVMKLTMNEEYNLRNIERLGVGNPLCPYTMYEDVANTSRIMMENTRILPNASLNYDKFLVLYNSAIEKYNRFSKVAAVSILKNITQMKNFELDTSGR
jgi:hypothetical protein